MHESVNIYKIKYHELKIKKGKEKCYASTSITIANEFD